MWVLFSILRDMILEVFVSMCFWLWGSPYIIAIIQLTIWPILVQYQPFGCSERWLGLKSMQTYHMRAIWLHCHMQRMRGWGAEMGKDCIVGCRKKMTGTRVVSQGGTDSEGRKAIGASRHSVSMMLCQGKNSLPLWTCHVGGIHQHNWIILLCSPNSKARIRCGAFWLDRDMRATWVVQGHELSLAATDSWDDTMGRDGTSTSSHHQLRLLRRPVASFVRKVFNLKGGVLTSGSFKCCGKSCFTF